MAYEEIALAYVIVTMAMALVGNTLVLVILCCRWGTKNASQVYILYLATLDLLCASVSTPREVMNLHAAIRGWNQTLDTGYLDIVQTYCGLSTYLTYVLNFTSALILVFIALTRYRKCAKHGEGHASVRSSVVRQKVWATLETLSSVRGAKVASGVALAVCVVYSGPALVSLARSPDKYHSCLHNVGPLYQQFVMPMQGAFFGFFLVTAALLMGLYGRVLCYVRIQQSHRRKAEQQRRSSTPFFKQTSCESAGSLFDTSGDLADVTGCREVTRTRSDGGSAERTVSGGGAEFHRSFSSPCNETELCRKSDQPGHAIKERPGSDPNANPANTLGPETNHPSFLPPVSYSAQMRSVIHLNTDKPSSAPEKEADRACRLSVSSLQFSKGGNAARQTTVVFFLITLIYIVSYLPFFIVELFGKDDVPGSELLLRSYLISNAFNPIVYVLCNHHFRAALWRLVRCRRDVI